MSLLASDTFTRADSASLGSTNGSGLLDPAPWTVTTSSSGNWTITTNRAVMTGSGFAMATIATGVANAVVQCTTLGGPPWDMGCCVRVSAPSSGNFQGIRGFGTGSAKYEWHGVNDNNDLFTGSNPASGDVLVFSADSNIIRGWINSRLIHIESIFRPSFATTHGIFGDSSGDVLDNFLCYTSPGVNAPTNVGWSVGQIGLGGVTLSAVPADSPVIYCSDNWQRAGNLSGSSTDGDGSLGACPYTVLRGTWTTTGAYPTAQGPDNTVMGASSMSIAGIETSTSDGEIYFTGRIATSGYLGVAFRIVDANNFWWAGSTGGGGAHQIHIVVAGVDTLVASGGSGATSIGRVVFNGDHLQYFNHGGVTADIDIHDSRFQTATVHGFYNGTTFALNNQLLESWLFTAPR